MSVESFRTLDRHKRVDWPRVVFALNASGMTMQEIADAVGISYGTVRSYREDFRAIEPAFWAAIRLLILWSETTGKSLAEAPTKKHSPTVSRLRGTDRRQRALFPDFENC